MPTADKTHFVEVYEGLVSHYQWLIYMILYIIQKLTFETIEWCTNNTFLMHIRSDSKFDSYNLYPLGTDISSDIP